VNETVPRLTEYPNSGLLPTGGWNKPGLTELVDTKPAW
jgi:hypothetical protein